MDCGRHQRQQHQMDQFRWELCERGPGRRSPNAERAGSAENVNPEDLSFPNGELIKGKLHCKHKRSSRRGRLKNNFIVRDTNSAPVLCGQPAVTYLTPQYIYPKRGNKAVWIRGSFLCAACGAAILTSKKWRKLLVTESVEDGYNRIVDQAIEQEIKDSFEGRTKRLRYAEPFGVSGRRAIGVKP